MGGDASGSAFALLSLFFLFFGLRLPAGADFVATGDGGVSGYTRRNSCSSADFDLRESLLMTCTF